MRPDDRGAREEARLSSMHMLSQRIRYSDATLQYEIVILGGLTGRLDQTIHTLSYLYKLRKTRERVFTVTDDNVAWILDSVSLLSLLS